MNATQMEVLRKIIYAVETGGQVYGRCNYGDFTEAYTNSSAEHAISIGGGAWYGTEALALLKKIMKAGGQGFTSELMDAMASEPWNTIMIKKNSALAKTIVAVITTEIGKACQDKLLDEQMAVYVREAAELGVTDPDAQAMCANFRHQGGYGAMKRVISKTSRPYTLDNLYQATLSDTGNQVGAYRTRQKKVYEWLKAYMPQTESKDKPMIDYESIIVKVLNTAIDEIGYLEKRSNSQLDSKTANAGSGNYTKYWVAVYLAYQGQPWCACFVAYCFMIAFGLETAKRMLKHWPFVYCPTLAGMTSNKTPHRGDIILFYRNGEYVHTGIVESVVGSVVHTIEGNTSGASGIIDNGGGVCRKHYNLADLSSNTKYFRPDYSLAAGGSGPGDKFRPVLRAGDKGEVVKELQDLLNQNGANLIIDGDFGRLTLAAVMDFQTRHLLGIDGIVGSKTWNELDHQIRKVKRTPGKLRKSPRKVSKCVENLKAGTEVRVFEYAYNDINQKWARVADGWIIAENLE